MRRRTPFRAQLRPAPLHRRVGIGAALFIIVLAVSGLLLNHTDTLKLDQRQVDSSLLLQWYGIDIPDQASHFNSGDNRVSQLGEQLYFNSQALLSSKQPLIGITSNKQLTIVALSNALLLLSHEGELLERLDTLPQGINGIDAIGSDAGGNVAIRQGALIALADQELLSWQEAAPQLHIQWSHASQVDAAYSNSLLSNYRQQTLDYERVLLDLHSGRLFGQWGPYVMDAAAVAMVLLALTGLWRSLKGRARKLC